MINSHSCSRLKRSSPILPCSSSFHSWSLSGCWFHFAKYPLNPFTPTSDVFPYSSTVLTAWCQICAKVSSSLFGVLVTIHLPPVANVGDKDVQNSLAILCGTNANSSK